MIQKVYISERHPKKYLPVHHQDLPPGTLCCVLGLLPTGNHRPRGRTPPGIAFTHHPHKRVLNKILLITTRRPFKSRRLRRRPTVTLSWTLCSHWTGAPRALGRPHGCLPREEPVVREAFRPHSHQRSISSDVVLAERSSAP